MTVNHAAIVAEATPRRLPPALLRSPFVLVAVKIRSAWFGALSVFVIMYCWRGFKLARALYQLANAPRNEAFHCPACKAAPPTGNFWLCSQCKGRFDTFMTRAVCPRCAKQFPETMCTECGQKHAISAWSTAVPTTPIMVPELIVK